MEKEMCNCKNELVQMPVSAHEADMEREDRKHKRNFIIILVLILALLASNGAWIWYESQWEDVVTTVTQEGEADGDGTVLLNNGGDMNYGESETDSNN